MIGRKYNMTRKIKILSANKYTFYDLHFYLIGSLGPVDTWSLGLSADWSAADRYGPVKPVCAQK